MLHNFTSIILSDDLLENFLGQWCSRPQDVGSDRLGECLGHNNFRSGRLVYGGDGFFKEPEG